MSAHDIRSELAVAAFNEGVAFQSIGLSSSACGYAWGSDAWQEFMRGFDWANNNRESDEQDLVQAARTWC